MCGCSTCELVVMADWRFLRTGNKSNNHRSLRTCLFACTAAACGAWTRMSRAPCLLDSRRGCVRRANNAPECSASARVQASGGAISMAKGELVFDGVAISDTSAAVRRPSAARAGLAPPAACVRAAGLRRTGAACRVTEAQFTWSVAPSRSEGAARSRARKRCARPGARHRARARAIVVLVCGASTSTGTGTRV